MKVIGTMLLIALLNTGCSLVERDLTRFNELTNQFGTPGDQRCSALLVSYWSKLDAIIGASTPFPAAISDAYKIVLTNRVQQQMRLEITQECGQFAAEMLLMVGRTANTFRP